MAPLTSSELAAETGLAERYLREWLSAQAAYNCIAYDPLEGDRVRLRSGGCGEKCKELKL
jgi:hypothetical protein